MLKQFLLTALCGTLLIPNVAVVHAEETKYESDGHVKASGITVKYRSEDEIRDYVSKNGPKYLAPNYITEPNYTNAPYAAGELSQETLDDALKAVNTIRYIAGLEPEVDLNTKYTERVQAGAVINAVINDIDHYPKQPSGMDDNLYTLGYQGNSNANLALGYDTLASAVTNGWLEDGDEGNIARIGHRRWLLNAKMKETGFGQAGNMTGMYSTDTYGSSTYTSNVWPAQNTPVEYFGKDYPWSVSTGSDETLENVSVTMTDKRGNEYKFFKGCTDGYFNVNNEGAGVNGAIIWRPNNITYAPDDQYNVSITGLSDNQTISYTVNFFQLYESESVTISPTSLKIGVGETATITASFLPITSTAFISSCSAEYYGGISFDYDVSEDKRSVIVTGKAVGTGTIIIESSNGFTYEVPVNVVDKTVAVTSVSIDQHELSLFTDETTQLTTTVLPENAVNKNISWTSSDDTVATVDQNGLITAISAGTATITAASEENPKIFDQCAVTVEVSAEPVIVRSASLTLNGYIGINFYVSVPDDQLEDTVIYISRNGKEEKTFNAWETEIETTKEGIKRQKYSYPLAAKQMRDKVVLTVTDKEGKRKKLENADGVSFANGYEYSVEKYIAAANKYYKDNTKLISLLEQMDLYGKWAQKQFNYDAGSVQPEEITEKQVSLETLSAYKGKPDGDTQSIEMTATLTLESGTDINFYFVLPKEENISSYEITIDGKEAEVIKDSDTKTGVKYKVSIKDIAAKDLDKEHILKVEKGEKKIGLTYSALSYAYTVVEMYTGKADRSNLVNLVKALYLYWQAADQYF